MIVKPFNKELHNQYDSIGRNVVISYFLNELEIDARDNPNIYGVDLILYKDGTMIGFAEVEVRSNWNSDEFPYDTLNVPCRKEKLLKNNLPTFFFSINKILTKMFCCSAEEVMGSEVRENKNKYINENEFFYKVPVKNLILISINETINQGEVK